MKYSYELNGSYNNYPIKTKRFKTLKAAYAAMDKIILDKNLEVAYTISSENASTYVINDYSRFILERI
ncbi:MAG: hypothetical protein IJU60_01450 [Acholeplasmatales bacterium]|nr:hypothetical protein [Acholeplasmatales bacterium]